MRPSFDNDAKYGPTDEVLVYGARGARVRLLDGVVLYITRPGDALAEGELIGR